LDEIKALFFFTLYLWKATFVSTMVITSVVVVAVISAPPVNYLGLVSGNLPKICFDTISNITLKKFGKEGSKNEKE
jgi:hypothetical protein